jgi:hypothetical protein
VGHPWELTLRQLVEKVRHDYGIELAVVPLPVPGTILCLGATIYPLPEIDEDDLLDIAVLESICDCFRLPRADFSLDPDPDD